MHPRRPLLRRISQERLTWVLRPSFANTGLTNPNPPPAPPHPSARGTPGPAIPHAPRCRWQHRLPPSRRHHRLPPSLPSNLDFPLPTPPSTPACSANSPTAPKTSSPSPKPPPKPALTTSRSWWNSASCPFGTPDGRRCTCAPVFLFPGPAFSYSPSWSCCMPRAGHDSGEHGDLLHPETIKHDNLLLQTAGRYTGSPRCGIRFCSFLPMESGERAGKYLEILCISI